MMNRTYALVCIAMAALLGAMGVSAGDYTFTATQARCLTGGGHEGRPHYSAWQPSSATIDFALDTVRITDGDNAYAMAITSAKMHGDTYVMAGNSGERTTMVSIKLNDNGTVIVKKIAGRASVEYMLNNDMRINRFIDELIPSDRIKEPPMEVVAALPPNEAFKALSKMTRPGAEQQPQRDRPLPVVEQLPVFPGGSVALDEYIATHFRYPEKALKNGVSGKIIVQLTVYKDGSVGDVKVVQSVDPDLDREAVRVCESLPKFLPGRINGQVVDMQYTVPITIDTQH